MKLTFASPSNRAQMYPEKTENVVTFACTFFYSKTDIADVSVRVVKPLGPPMENPGGKALDAGYHDKHNQYDALAEAENSSMSALIVETHGRMHPEFMQYILKVTKAAVDNGTIRSDIRSQKEFTNRSIQRISIALQKGNGRIGTQALYTFRAHTKRNAFRHRAH